jgi:hypothetical protein
MADDQYIAAHVTAYPAAKGHVLVSNRSTSRSGVLSDQLFGILRQVDRFDTIAGHEKRLLALGWEDDGSGFIESAFQELISQGLLVSTRAFHSALFEKTGELEAPPPISSLVVTTRDRITQLQQCLTSYIENNEKHGRRPDYIVLDDSHNKDQGASLRAALAPVAAGGARIFFAGMEEKARFADELVRVSGGDGLPAEVVSFALFGDEAYRRTVGANRNALLMAAPGELSIMADDDTVCQPAVMTEADAVLSLSSMKDPTVTCFYADRKQLVQSVHATEIDLFACHEKLLGRSIAACLSSLGPSSSIDLERINPDSVDYFGRATKSVKATAAGFWGDSGVDSAHYVLELRGESRDLLMQSKKLYARARESREVFRSVPRYTISDGAVFIPMSAGIDNRSLLPPFLPVGRNSDGLFAMTLRLCADDALVGHIPFAVQHRPPEGRRYAPSTEAPGLPEILSAISHAFRPSAGRADISDRLSDFGQFLVDVGSLSSADFKGYVESAWVAAASRYISYLEYLLDLYHGEPDYWAEDILSFIEGLTDFTVHNSAAAPRELLETQSPEQAMETCRRVVRKFGELLQWWPVIDDAARRLREAGARLARPL